MKTHLKLVPGLILGCGMILVIFAFVLTKPVFKAYQDLGKSDSQPFPELLTRNDALKQTAEWQSHVHHVSALSARLIQNPGDAQALTELAQIYCIEARVTGEHGYYFPVILDMLDKALAQNELSEKTLFEATALKANVLLSQHRFHEGLTVAEKAHAMNPYSAQVFAALIDANVELGNYRRAVELTDEMMNIHPGLMAYARASYLRELHGDLDGAIEAMEMAVEAGYPGYENTEWSRIHLAKLYEMQGEMQKAENIYKYSLQFRENNPFAQAGLAGILISKGEYEKAEVMLKTVLAIVPEISFQEDLYRLYKAWGKAEEASEAYAGVIEMIEDDAAHGHKVSLEYAMILFDLGGDAEGALDKVIQEYQSRPENIGVNALLARIYVELGKDELAKTHLQKALVTGYQSAVLDNLKTRLL
ncbi:MAG TPA: tetratricopeptide repeat protein [Saprospiraceae bacterium]|nr:tetratricopeptide repeat protein [Saprospiraceae bacterium]